jgi:hypothetical protein
MVGEALVAQGAAAAGAELSRRARWVIGTGLGQNPGARLEDGLSSSEGFKLIRTKLAESDDVSVPERFFLPWVEPPRIVFIGAVDKCSIAATEVAQVEAPVPEFNRSVGLRDRFLVQSNIGGILSSDQRANARDLQRRTTVEETKATALVFWDRFGLSLAPEEENNKNADS